MNKTTNKTKFYNMNLILESDECDEQFKPVYEVLNIN